MPGMVALLLTGATMNAGAAGTQSWMGCRALSGTRSCRRGYVALAAVTVSLVKRCRRSYSRQPCERLRLHPTTATAGPAARPVAGTFEDALTG